VYLASMVASRDKITEFRLDRRKATVM